MKKIISILCSFFLVLSCFGCSKEETSVELKKNVECELLDVLKINNSKDNSVFYYYLASISNDGKKSYNTGNLSYKITDDGNDISVIDKYQSTPVNSIEKGQNTYIYGFVGFPNNNQKNLGISFTKQKKFLSFSGFNVKEVDSNSITRSKKAKYTFYEDDSLKINIDASKATYNFIDGKTILKNVKIIYKNLSDERIIVPYLTPTATLDGIDLSKYEDKGDYSSMDLETLKRIDFTNDGMSPQTYNIKGTTTGYVLYFLDKEQKVTCNLEFYFENAAPDFSDTENKPFTIHMTSAPFGVSNNYKVGL